MTSRTILFFIFITMPINAAVAAGCPAFNGGMIDAAMMATYYSQPEPVIGVAEDSKTESYIYCEWVNDDEGEFLVSVGDGEAELYGRSFSTDVRTRVFNLSAADLKACRKEVLDSFVWQQHCAALMP